MGNIGRILISPESIFSCTSKMVVAFTLIIPNLSYSAFTCSSVVPLGINKESKWTARRSTSPLLVEEANSSVNSLNFVGSKRSSKTGMIKYLSSSTVVSDSKILGEALKN